MKKKKKRKEKNLDDYMECLPPEFRNTWDRMPDEMKEYFIESAEKSATPEEFIARIMVGNCPQCGSIETASCEQMENIEDPTVGYCKECGFLWCLECEAPILPGIECPHWDICRNCEIPKDENGNCGKFPFECEPVLHWFQKNDVTFPEIICSWCNKPVPEGKEFIVIGAKLKNPSPLNIHSKGRCELALSSCSEKIQAIVPTSDSAAKKKGSDLIFTICSERCLMKLTEAMDKDNLISRIIVDESP